MALAPALAGPLAASSFRLPQLLPSPWRRCSSFRTAQAPVCRSGTSNKAGETRRGSCSISTRGKAGWRTVAAALSVAADVDVAAPALPEALLFDCDGVLVDTERDGHRVSFNQAFEEKSLGVEWGVQLYGDLLKIGGGKERMTHYFNSVGWPAAAPVGEAERKEFIAHLHARKTTLFMNLVNTGALPLRPGVDRLVDEALAAGVRVGVCSTSNERAVRAIVETMLGPMRAQHITIFAGDIVPKKKPHPAIYNLAASTLNVNPSRCIVVEDSHIGLSAAKAAGMICIVTKSGYTADEDFSAADAIFDEIGATRADGFGLADLSALLEQAANSSA